MNRSNVQRQRLMELADICLEQSRAASTPRLIAELRRMAKEYEQRAARLTGQTAENSAG
jgi:hypothetical protein